VAPSIDDELDARDLSPPVKAVAVAEDCRGPSDEQVVRERVFQLELEVRVYRPSARLLGISNRRHER
jgi:hypothetical protein